MGVTIHIGLGFVIGSALAIVFLVAWVKNVVNEEKVSKVGAAIEKVAVRIAARFAVALLEDPVVNERLTTLIAGGINAWLVNPDAQDHIEHLIKGAPKAEAARELGKQLPGLAASFSRGMMDGVFTKKKKEGIESSTSSSSIASGSSSSIKIGGADSK
mmetsp:Transcript_9631/g.15793  ORF Transcript_9631/g.15793 Transcript_9631/m.15793 type:complete len:158 (-) Transcript_9631:1046-1519(-)